MSLTGKSNCRQTHKQVVGALLILWCAEGGVAGTVLHFKKHNVDTGATGSRGLERVPDPGKRLTEGRSRLIVQFRHPPAAAERELLKGLQGEVLGAAPVDGLMVSFPDDAAVGTLFPAVVYLGRLPPEDKVSSLLERMAVRGLMVVEFFPDVTARQGSEILRRTGMREVESAGLLSYQKLVWGGKAEASALAEWDETAYLFPAEGDGLTMGVPCRSGVIAAAGSPPARVEQYVANSSPAVAGESAGATVGYVIEPVPYGMAWDDVRHAFEAALAEWMRYSNLEFRMAGAGTDAGTVSVKFASGDHGDGYPFDGPGGVLAHTFYPAPVNDEPLAGDMHLDLDEIWTSADLYSVMLHEIGHALGLAHSDDPAAVMYPWYRRVSGLGASEIKLVRSMYGVKLVDGEADQSEIRLEITDVFRNVADFASGELVAIGGKAWGGEGLKVRWEYATNGVWTAAPGAFQWMAPMVPIFGVDVDVIVEVSDDQGRVARQTVHIPVNH